MISTIFRKEKLKMCVWLLNFDSTNFGEFCTFCSFALKTTTFGKWHDDYKWDDI